MRRFGGRELEEADERRGKGEGLGGQGEEEREEESEFHVLALVG